MNYKLKNSGQRSITQFVIKSPDVEDCVCLDTTDNYKDMFVIDDIGEHNCQVIIPLSCIDTLIHNLKRAGDHAKLLTKP